ncbi:Legumain, partial [Trichinella papuae]
LFLNNQLNITEKHLNLIFFSFASFIILIFTCRFNMPSIWSFVHLLVLFKFTTLVISDENPSNKWALLVAGSNGWYNYRHQADICHAYQILRKHGIPDSNIVVMMYDDIAYNEENKLSGKIINHPDGVDVYHNVPKDYIGKASHWLNICTDVNVKNFMNILLGKEKEMQHIGSGKVIKSGPNDHIFINFVDHGGSGILCFPEGEVREVSVECEEKLLAHSFTFQMTIGELNKTLTEMYRLKKYGQMLIYIEACESGSMFKNVLPNNIKIYATTAANARESSYACYFSDELETYLGDCYSVNWMENSDKELLWLETVGEQYKIVKFETNTSHVSEFGDRSVSKDYLSDFQGEEIFLKFGSSLFSQLLQPHQQQNIRPPNVYLDAVSSRDVPLEILKRKISKNGYESNDAKQNLHSLLLKRKYVDEFINQMVGEISKHFHLNHEAMLTKRVADVMDFDCHTKLVHHFSRNCFSFSKNAYALKYAYVLTNLCNTGIPVNEILIRMEESCKTAKMYSNIV